MLIFDLADTSRKGMPSSSANCCPCSVDTARFSSQSHLLPIRILLTPSLACCSTLENHVLMSVHNISQWLASGAGLLGSGNILLKLFSSVTS